MNVSFRLSRKRVAFAIVIASLAAAGGIAYAAIPDAGVIHGCFSNYAVQGNHAVWVTESTCPAGSTALNWNQQGARGDVGPQGLKGDKGDPGQGVIVAELPQGASLPIFDSPSLGKMEALGVGMGCHWTLNNTTAHELTVLWRFTDSAPSGTFTVAPGELHLNQGAVGRQLVKVTDGTDTKLVWLEGRVLGFNCVISAAASN